MKGARQVAREWFVRANGREIGPISSAQLKSLANAGKITPDSEVKLAGGKWAQASRVEGLFPVPMGIALPVPVPPPPTPIVVDSTAEERKRCSLCGEWISIQAVKCRHCNEYLDGRQLAMAQPAPVAQAQPVHVVQQVVVQNQVPRFNPLVAALLSFFIPGLGQIYKGQPFNGLVWFFVTLVGYVAFVLPGLILHLCCVIGAASGNRYR